MLQVLAILTLLAAAAEPAGDPGADAGQLLLVLPVLDPAPPELVLPGIDLWVESLHLELGATPLRVEALRPAGLRDPAEVEREARQRGVELGAAAVLWARLSPPEAGCPAARALRLVLLSPATGESVERVLCPAAGEGPAGTEELARAMALAALHALQAGDLPGVVLPAPPAPRLAIPAAPACPECPGCPACAACPVPEDGPDPAGPDRGLLRLRAGLAYSSQPSWSAASLGPELSLAWAPLDWLELGLGVAVFRGRRVEVDRVQALHGSVPLQVWVGGLWGGPRWQLGLDLGMLVSWTHLDALLPDQGTTAGVERWNPAALGRAVGRFWTPWNFAIQLQIGAHVHLLRQRYVYSHGPEQATVLSMQPASLEAGLSLVIPLVPAD